MFLYHCVQAGLDMAIVNSETLERYVSIPEEERRLSEDLIWWRGEDPIAASTAHFRTKAPKKTVEQRLDLPLDERLGLYILEGSTAYTATSTRRCTEDAARDHQRPANKGHGRDDRRRSPVGHLEPHLDKR